MDRNAKKALLISFMIIPSLFAAAWAFDAFSSWLDTAPDTHIADDAQRRHEGVDDGIPDPTMGPDSYDDLIDRVKERVVDENSVSGN